MRRWLTLSTAGVAAFGLTDMPDGTSLPRTMLRLRRDIGMLRRAARGAGGDAQLEQVAEAWSGATAAGAAMREEDRPDPSGRHAPEDRNRLAQAVRGYRAAADGTRRAGLAGAIPTAAVGRLLGIGFALSSFGAISMT